MQISPKVKKVWDTAMTVLVVLVVLLAVLLVGVRLCGLQVYSVLSGSMEPDYPVGSLIYVRKVDYKALKPNDVITYRLDEKTLSTHRIVRVQTEGGYRFYMKGDANDDPDGAPVLPEDILGEIVFGIPLLGYVAFYIQHPPGLYIAIAVGAILVMLTFLPDLLQSEQKTSPSAEAEEESQAHI